MVMETLKGPNLDLHQKMVLPVVVPDVDTLHGNLNKMKNPHRFRMNICITWKLDGEWKKISNKMLGKGYSYISQSLLNLIFDLSTEFLK